MTRINIGIEPQELCDQHLIAEYRELPRAFARKYVFPKSKPPFKFKLNTGHILWCAKHATSLAFRYRLIVHEMEHRMFNVNFPDPRERLNDGIWTQEDEVGARPLLIERIIQQLGNMEKEPRWTKRQHPEWVADVLKARQHKEKTNEPT